MKRRFTDIEKWTPWFRKLPPEFKLFWIFIHDDCDEVGVWNVDFEKAEFYTGCKYDIEELKKAFAGKVAIPESNSKWWILDYVELQYKELRLPTPLEISLNPKLKHSPAPRYVNLLKVHGLWELYQEMLKNPHLTPSELPLNSHEEEEEEEKEEEEEVYKEEEVKDRSFESEQDLTPQKVKVEAQDEKKDTSINNKKKSAENFDEKFDEFLKSAESKKLQKATPYDMTH